MCQQCVRPDFSYQDVWAYNQIFCFFLPILLRLKTKSHSYGSIWLKTKSHSYGSIWLFIAQINEIAATPTGFWSKIVWFTVKLCHSMKQSWKFIFKRARGFFICKGHFHWKILKSMGSFWRGTKAKTSGQGRPWPVWPSCHSKSGIVCGSSEQETPWVSRGFSQ